MNVGRADTFRLRFDPTTVPYWADRYSYPGDEIIEREVAPRAKRMGYLRKPDFLTICRWKTRRQVRRHAKNPEGFIAEVTGTALTTVDERLRIEVLTLLDGVGWPTASVILHFTHSDPYPILDYRALWSLGVEASPARYSELWRGYTDYCRRLSARLGISMRRLDRALWQYSNENQGPVPPVVKRDA